MAVTLTGALSSGFLLPDAPAVFSSEAADSAAPTVSPASLTVAASGSDVALRERASRSLERQALVASQAKELAARRVIIAERVAAQKAAAKKAAAHAREVARSKARALAKAKAKARSRAVAKAEARLAAKARARAATQAERLVPTRTRVSRSSYRGVPARVASLNWSAMAKCESGGNPRAANPSGKYLGLYQFDVRTWQGVGGSGRPDNASASEQTYRAQLLYLDRGASPWPVCGRRL